MSESISDRLPKVFSAGCPGSRGVRDPGLRPDKPSPCVLHHSTNQFLFLLWRHALGLRALARWTRPSRLVATVTTQVSKDARPAPPAEAQELVGVAALRLAIIIPLGRGLTPPP